MFYHIDSTQRWGTPKSLMFCDRLLHVTNILDKSGTLRDLGDSFVIWPGGWGAWNILTRCPVVFTATFGEFVGCWFPWFWLSKSIFWWLDSLILACDVQVVAAFIFCHLNSIDFASWRHHGPNPSETMAVHCIEVCWTRAEIMSRTLQMLRCSSLFWRRKRQSIAGRWLSVIVYPNASNDASQWL